MTARRHRKWRKHRTRLAGGASKAAARSETPALGTIVTPGRGVEVRPTSGRTGQQVRQGAANGITSNTKSGWEQVAAATLPVTRAGANSRVRLGSLPRLKMLLLPGRSFFVIGRPISGLLCYALQASIVGWVLAVLWSMSAQRRVEGKQLTLAARLRPN